MRFDLIVGFVNPSLTEKVIKTAKKAGATGDVVIQGKGSGLDQGSFLGMPIQSRTDIILFVVEEHHTKKITDSVSEECNIEEAGNGIMIVVNIDRVAGLSRQIERIRENVNNEEL
jgi:nitrogen regulatory protein PII